MRIMVIEDNAGDVELLRYALSEADMDHSLEVMASGDKAIAHLFSAKVKELPDLIILDLNLPRAHGHEVLDMLKNNSRTKAIPVLILSASSARRDINRS